MNHQARAFGASLALHAAAVLIAFTLSGAAAPPEKLRVIDLRILDLTGGEIASLSKREPMPKSAPPQRKASVPRAEDRPRVQSQIVETPPPAMPVPAPVEALAPPVAERAPQPEATPVVAGDEAVPERVPAMSATPSTAIDREGAEKAVASPSSDTAAAATASAIAPGGMTGSVVAAAAIPEPSAVLRGDERGHLPRDFSSLREIIQRHLVYPNAARRLGWEGKVTLSFIVGGSGHVREIAVLESSGRELLDRNAVETVKRISCFPAVAAEAQVIIPVVYRLN